MFVEGKVTRWSRYGFTGSFDGDKYGDGDTHQIWYFLTPSRVNMQYVKRLRYTRIGEGWNISEEARLSRLRLILWWQLCYGVCVHTLLFEFQYPAHTFTVFIYSS